MLVALWKKKPAELNANYNKHTATPLIVSFALPLFHLFEFDIEASFLKYIFIVPTDLCVCVFFRFYFQR